MSQVESPCIGVCSLRNNICQGCYRTAEEVEQWDSYTDTQKQEIVDRIEHDLFN